MNYILYHSGLKHEYKINEYLDNVRKVYNRPQWLVCLDTRPQWPKTRY